MNENSYEIIDIKSDVVIGLASQYQSVNNEIASMASGCSKPAVPSFLNVGGHIDGLMNTVKEAESKLSTKMSEVVSLLNNTIDTIKANDEVNMLDFFTLEEDFNFGLDVNVAEEKELTDEDKQSILFSLCLYAGKDIAGFKDTIDSNEYLSETDKAYILEQLEKGNVRSAIGRMLCIQAEEDLEYITKINEEEIDAINEKIQDLHVEVNNLGLLNPDDPKIDDYLAEIEKLKKQKSELQNEITAQRLKVNQYKNSEKEWEYDYLLNSIGKQSVEEITKDNKDRDFYLLALKNYYSDPDRIFSPSDDYTFDYNKFCGSTEKWLLYGDNGLDEETKQEYLEKLKDIKKYASVRKEDCYSFDLAVQELAGDTSFNNEQFAKSFDGGALNVLEKVPEYKEAIKYFDEEHLNLLHYYYSNGDTEGANAYLKTFSDYFNKCKGYENAEKIFKDIIKNENQASALGDLSSFVNGAGVGIEGWFQAVGNLLSTNGEMTESEYTQMYVNNMLGTIGYLVPITENVSFNDFGPDLIETTRLKENDLDITDEEFDKLKKLYGNCFSTLDVLYTRGQISEEDYSNMQKLANSSEIQKFICNANDKDWFGRTRTDWLQTFFGAGVSMGNMLPSVAISFATSGLLSEFGVAANTAQTVGRAAGLGAMALGCASTSKNAALRSGRSELQAWTYGILSGLSETATEYLIGGMPGLSRLDKAFKLIPSDKTFSIIGKSLLNTFAIGPGQEITEEMLQAFILDPLVTELAYGESSNPVTIDQALEIALQTYFSTLGLGGFTAIPQTTGVISISNTVVGTIDINGKTYEVTYGKLMDAIDPKTGKISDEKIIQILSNEQSSRAEYNALLKYFAKAGNINSPIINLYATDYVDFIMSEQNSDTITVFNEKGNGTVSFSKEELIKIFDSLNNDETFDKLTELASKISTGINGAEGITLDGYNLAELANAAHEFFYSNVSKDNQYYVITRLMNIYDSLGGKDRYIDNIDSLNDEQISNLLKSTLSGSEEIDILLKLSKSKRGQKLLLENDRINLPTIDYVYKGNEAHLEGKDLFLYLLKNNLSYDTIDEQAINGLTQGDIAEIIMTMSELGFNEGRTNIESIVADSEDEITFMANTNNASALTKNYYIWVHDELPSLFDVLGDMITEKTKSKIRNSVKLFDTKTEYVDYLGYKSAKKTRGVNKDGMMVSYVGEDGQILKHVLVHEANHTAGTVSNGPNYHGIDESLTELFAHGLEHANKTTHKKYVSYRPGTYGMDALIKANIPGLTKAEFKEAYYVTHDLTDIQTRIDEIMGPGYFENTFVPAFDTVLIEKEIDAKTSKDAIDKVVDDIKTIYQLQFN